MRRIPIPLLLALPLAVSSLRLREIAETESSGETDIGAEVDTQDDDEGKMMMGATMDNDERMAVIRLQRESTNSSVWPDSWMTAHEHGEMIAHMLDNTTLWDFVHAYTGPAPKYYQAQTIAVPEMGLPAIKMQHAVPGWEPRTVEESGRVTSFPSYMALAASWDKDLVYEVSQAVAEEFKTLGANVMFGPAINIHRATQHDEEFDSLSGEDPTLGAVLVRSWILGVQMHGIMSVPKYLGRSEQTSLHFENSSANMTSWDIYYPPFQQAIDCGAAGVMCASHEVNGLWSCRDSEMLERDLKKIMGFNGMVISDKGSAREYFRYSSSYEKGLDLELAEENVVPWSEHMDKGMRKAAVRVAASIWHMKFEENPGCQPPECSDDLVRMAKTDAHVEIAKKAAGSGIVLLKNEGNFLPLTRDKVHSVAVIGPAATQRKDYCRTDPDPRPPSKGCETPYHALAKYGENYGIHVINHIRGAQACVVIGGSISHASHWDIDPQTKEAIDEAMMMCPRLAVFLEISGSVLTPWRDMAQSVAVVFHSGEETAIGWAAVLFGEFSPSGKLPVSFPENGQDVTEWWTEALPSYWSNSLQFAFPFGHGLSYATFQYYEVKQKPACRYTVCIMVSVRNVNPKYAGAEVVQVYFRFGTDVNHPTVLRAFHKTRILQPGESEKVFFPFTTRDVSLYHDVGNHADAELSWMPERSIEVLVGSSSKDIRKTITITPKLA